MSLVLVPSTTIRLAEIFPHLTEGELERLRKTINLMDEKIFTPVIESSDKEEAIEQELYRYTFYLSQAFIPILPKLIDWFKQPKVIIDFYDFFRGEVKEKVFNRYSRRLIISALNVAEEHDRYVSKLLSNIGEFVTLIGKIGSEAYFRTFAKTSLAMVVVFLAMNRKPGTVKDLSQVVKKYVDELDPFIATFQVFLEPELAPLRKKTSETDVEKAKELRGSLFEILES